MQYQLCLPWYWEYDADFVQMVARSCLAQDVTFWQITPDNLLESITALYKGETTFKTILDRSQEEICFAPIHRWAREQHARRINPAELSAWSEDKTTMHLEFIQAGLQTPYTILLPPFIEQPLLPPFDLSALGEHFVIKPSNGGGGEGVILGASSIDHILRARMEFPEQKYLAQAHVTPRLIENKKAWFRSFYAAGKCYPCWWDPDTHIYTVISEQAETSHNLVELKEITKRIAAICKLDWFSTEIALTEDHFIVVDYVNDSIDLRLQSRAMDGVPDEIVNKIAGQLVQLAKENV